jgi:hypothetical protein
MVLRSLERRGVAPHPCGLIGQALSERLGRLVDLKVGLHHMLDDPLGHLLSRFVRGMHSQDRTHSSSGACTVRIGRMHSSSPLTRSSSGNHFGLRVWFSTSGQVDVHDDFRRYLLKPQVSYRLQRCSSVIIVFRLSVLRT